MLAFVIYKIFVEFGELNLKQNIEIHMGTNCVTLLVDIYFAPVGQTLCKDLSLQKLNYLLYHIHSFVLCPVKNSIEVSLKIEIKEIT